MFLSYGYVNDNVPAWTHTGSDRDAHQHLSALLDFWDKLPTMRCAGRPAAGLWGNVSRTEVSSPPRWLDLTRAALFLCCLPPLRPQHGAPPCSNWRGGRRAVLLIELRSGTVGRIGIEITGINTNSASRMSREIKIGPHLLEDGGWSCWYIFYCLQICAIGMYLCMKKYK